MCLKHRLGTLSEHEIDVSDDPRTDPRRSEAAAGAHRGDAGYELGLAQRAQLFGSVRPVHRMAFLKNGGPDVVAAAYVGQQFGKEIDVAGTGPQMMMRVDDGDGRLQDVLLALGQPRFIHYPREMVFCCRHGSSSSCLTITRTLPQMLRADNESGVPLRSSGLRA